MIDKKASLIFPLVLSIAGASACSTKRESARAGGASQHASESHKVQHANASHQSINAQAEQQQQTAHAKPRVPAHYENAKSVGKLPPVLPSERFFGPTREAYKAVGEIPQTIAQLPCYCYCDASFGHKSLHSCFVDDHAAQCAVCVKEALLAYKLQKEEKLTPAQIRERIIAEYSPAQ